MPACASRERAACDVRAAADARAAIRRAPRRTGTSGTSCTGPCTLACSAPLAASSKPAHAPPGARRAGAHARQQGCKKRQPHAAPGALVRGRGRVGGGDARVGRTPRTLVPSRRAARGPSAAPAPPQRRQAAAQRAAGAQPRQRAGGPRPPAPRCGGCSARHARAAACRTHAPWWSREAAAVDSCVTASLTRRYADVAS